jgi:hypothetical protein
MEHVVPLILTCERPVTAEFFASFGTVRTGMLRPVIVIDLSTKDRLSPGYLALVSSADPVAVYIHAKGPGLTSYDSVQTGIKAVLERALQETKDGDSILFLEDDVVFSSRFLETLQTLKMPHDAGFMSLYQPGAGYGSRVIDPNRFYGTQCILFPRRIVQEMVDDWDVLMTNFLPGYDIRWSRFLASRGYRLYCTDRSYVQHIGKDSALHARSAPQFFSRLFVP